MRFPVVTLCVLLSACASDPGWHGEHARPFDEAQAECRAQADAHAEALRQHAFEECMAEQGWTRPE
ncbi:hypothetical protein [Frateuria sp.]|uniref:hypothetical protein n=1 Tax=Frateuria sp. TaxID=2211372 RepID=UPI003F7EAFE2